MKTRFILAAAMGLALSSPSYAATNLVSNGSFENGTNPGGSFSTELSGSSAIQNWSVITDSVDYIGGYWQASDGVRSIDLSGYFQNGQIQQTIATTAGKHYLLSFDVSANPDQPLPNPRLGTALIDGTSYGISYALDGLNSKSNMEWASRSIQFTASGASTVIGFSGAPNSNLAWGVALDNVSVTAVPEPAVWVAMLFGFGLMGCALRVRKAGAAFA